MNRFAIVGTDTNVGKTVLSSLLMAVDERLCYWKPVQSGMESTTDSETIRLLSGCREERIVPEAYRLREPLSPHLSSARDGVTIALSELALPAAPDLVVETAGGVLVPYGSDLLQIDLLRSWDIPVLIAARSSLGTINHTLLTIEALRARKVSIRGFVMIGEPNVDNEAAVKTFGKIPLIGRIPELEHLDRETLLRTHHEHFV